MADQDSTHADGPSPRSRDYSSPPRGEPAGRSVVELFGGIVALAGFLVLIFNLRPMDNEHWALVGAFIAGLGVVIAIQGYILTEIRRSRRR